MHFYNLGARCHPVAVMTEGHCGGLKPCLPRAHRWGSYHSSSIVPNFCYHQARCPGDTPASRLAIKVTSRLSDPRLDLSMVLKISLNYYLNI